jgi:hypothetical protein
MSENWQSLVDTAALAGWMDRRGLQTVMRPCDAKRGY